MVKHVFLIIFIGVCVCSILERCDCAEEEFFLDDDEDSPLSQTCIKCICKVMGCIPDIGCVDNLCGPLRISQNYWEMAHYKTHSPDNVEDYNACTTNAWCAIRTVQRYMRQYLPKCEEQRPDRMRCENALALHKFGLNRCHRNLTEFTQGKFMGCLSDGVWAWLGDEE